jgi:hypothetical protein
MSDELPESFQVLHILRVRGLADGAAVASALGTTADTVTPILAGLAERGLVLRRELSSRTGWILLPPGLAQHEEELSAARDEDFERAVATGYERFLEVNRPMKELCTDWQMAGGGGSTEAVAEELDELRGVVGDGIDNAASVAPWFASYKDRLAGAAESFAKGDERFLISPQVDSFHTVWSECHEDFLVSLGRERSDRDE